MSLVFPNALAARSTSLALSRGTFWFGIAWLVSGSLLVALVAIDRGNPIALTAIVGLAIIGVGGVIVASPTGTRRRVILVGALVVLAGSAFYAAVVVPRISVSDGSDALALSLPKIAVVMFGAVAGRAVPGIASVVVAYFIAEAPVLVFALATGHPVTLDVPATICAVALVATFALLDVSSKRSRSSEPQLSRASRLDRAAAALELAEQRSSALVHDTILNDLTVIGTVAPGVLTPAAREQIVRSTTVTGAGEQVLATLPPEAELGGAIAAAVDRARADGLEVVVNGEVGAVDSLPAPTAAALGLAVAQCLANVAAHSGTTSAELAIVATDTDLCVMVIDSGRGFDEQRVPSDRLGLRRSVRGRIADVGGEVQIWSAPGAGTAVSMLVPRS